MQTIESVSIEAWDLSARERPSASRSTRWGQQTSLGPFSRTAKPARRFRPCLPGPGIALPAGVHARSVPPAASHHGCCLGYAEFMHVG
jgi:hypothetical protein